MNEHKLLNCSLYVSSERNYTDINKNGSYEELVDRIVDITKKEGRSVSNFPIFVKDDFFKAIIALDQSIFKRNFLGVLLTCFSPNNLLDRFENKEMHIGYISTEIVNNTSEMILPIRNEIVESRESDTFSSIQKAINIAFTEAKSNNSCIVALYEYLPIKMLSAQELEKKKAAGKLHLFTRFRNNINDS